MALKASNDHPFRAFFLKEFDYLKNTTEFERQTNYFMFYLPSPLFYLLHAFFLFLLYSNLRYTKTVNSVASLYFRWHNFEHGAATYVPT